MKKITSLFISLLFAGVFAHAQVLIVKWTFPTGNMTDSIADGGLPVNLDKAIHTEGGTSAIDFSKNGNTTKAAQATGWDNGSLLKCWVVKLNTQTYDNLKLSSKMQSGGNNPGPKDYKVQYRVGATGDWADVPGTTIVTANDWGTGKLDSVLLPSACNNVSSLYLRWIMTSNNNSSGGTVASTGIDKIDDIYVYGKQINTAVREGKAEVSCSVTPNPSHGRFTVESPESISTVTVFSNGGKCIYSQNSVHAKSINLKLDSIAHGTYFLKIKTASGKEGNQKLIIL